jgi:hypothetical protein
LRIGDNRFYQHTALWQADNGLSVTYHPFRV